MSQLNCPSCGVKAHREVTQWGYKNKCETCQLFSWREDPLVTQATLSARRRAYYARLLVVDKYEIPTKRLSKVAHNHLSLEEANDLFNKYGKIIVGSKYGKNEHHILEGNGKYYYINFA